MTRPDAATQVLTVLPDFPYPVARHAVQAPQDYTVQRGDTLSGIARAQCGSAADYPSLASASHVQNPNLIFPGERVRLACHAAVTAAVQRAISEQLAPVHHGSAAPVVTITHVSGSPQAIAQQMLDAAGEGGQFSCLDSLWNRESGWNVYASNPSSGAYGIPQALPAGKMASAGPDWQTSPVTQIRWGLSYIDSIYGSPCGAWSHEEAAGWY